MALFGIWRLSSFTAPKFVNVVRPREDGTARGYSRYPPHFILPEFKKERLNELYETGEAEKLAHLPTRAARSHDTCSVFHDELTRKLVNYVLRCGDKVVARDLVEKAYKNVKCLLLERYYNAPEGEREGILMEPREVLRRAVINCQPLLKLMRIKRGGIYYSVPVPVTPEESRTFAMKWLIDAANDKERTIHFPEKFAWELIDAANNTGRVVKKKDDLHRQCEANRAYAHYRWR